MDCSISLVDLTLFLSDDAISLGDLILQACNMIVQVLYLVLQVAHSISVFIDNFIQSILCHSLFFSSGCFHSIIQLDLPFFDQSFLLQLKLGSEGILTVEFLCQELIVLLIVFLDVGS